MLLALTLTASLAHAADGVQAQIFPSGMDKLAGAFEDSAFDIDKAEVGAEYDCWDYVGVKNLNLHIPLHTIDLDTSSDGLTLTLTFDQIHGEDMEVYSTDEDWLDSCIEFDGTVKYIRLDNAVLQATIRPGVDAGALAFEVVGTPTLTGDLDTDVEWFPDDLVLAFFEDTILETIASSVGDYAPALLGEALSGPLFEGSYADFDYAMTVTDAETSDDGVRAEAHADVGWSGDDGCPGGEGDVTGRDPRLEFGDGDGSALAVGLTEGQVDEALLSLWEDGYFCFTRENVQEFLTTVQSLFDPSIANISSLASLDRAPVVTIDPRGISVTLQGFTIDVDGDLDGSPTRLLHVTGNIGARGEVALHQDIGAFTLSLTELDLEFTAFEAEHLVTENPDAEAELRNFLEGWVTQWAERSIADLPLYPSLLHLADWYLKVDQLRYVDGGLLLNLSLYAADDPAVDTSAPDTEASAEVVGEDGVALTWSGTDDRDGDLAYAWSLDASGWSAWTADETYATDGLDPGTHLVRVKARDAWWNEDATPAQLTFDIAAPDVKGGGDGGGGCGCGTASGSQAVAWAAILFGAALARRRQR